jgi:uncharacterized protein
MSRRLATLIVIAKQPVPGRVKTRLVPELTYQQAADVAEAALRDTLEVASAVPAERHLLALDGDPGEWLPAGWQVTPQPAGGLDARLVGAFEAAGHGPALLIGMDTPQVTLAQLSAFDPGRFDACLGLAADGGYWAIGLRRPGIAAGVIAGVPMSTAHTGVDQLIRLRAQRMDVQLLGELTDVDTMDVARTVAEMAPHTRFAAALRSSSAFASSAVQ